MSSQPATKDDLHIVADGLRETIRENTREIIAFVQESQAAQDGRTNARFTALDTKLDAVAEDVAKVKMAVVDLLATDRHLHNLVRELKAQKIHLDETKIFAQ
jgi:hypothetical protein